MLANPGRDGLAPYTTHTVVYSIRYTVYGIRDVQSDPIDKHMLVLGFRQAEVQVLRSEFVSGLPTTGRPKRG